MSEKKIEVPGAVIGDAPTATKRPVVPLAKVLEVLKEARFELPGKVCDDDPPRLLVRLLERDDMTAGGIILPDKAQSERMAAEVIMLGPDVPDGWVYPGDIIAMYRNSLGEMPELDRLILGGVGDHTQFNVINANRDIEGIFRRGEDDAPRRGESGESHRNRIGKGDET